MNKSDDTYLSGQNIGFIEEIYEQYLKDPESVDQSWIEFFGDLDTHKKKPVWNDIDNIKIRYKYRNIIDNNYDNSLSQKAYLMILAYRDRGHFLANLDPLDLEIKKTKKDLNLDLDYFGINESDKNKIISIDDDILSLKNIPISHLIDLLDNIYCKNIALESNYIQDLDRKAWLQNKFESSINNSLNIDQKKKILNDIIETEGFEQYLHTKFHGTKRFSIEGGASAINSIETIIENLAKYDFTEIIFGMAHRGRLNVLTKILGKSYHSMISEFQGNLAYPEDMNISGDVKYHLGHSNDRIIDDKKIHLSLVPNPSHLETVNAIVMGKVRAIQDITDDSNKDKIASILIHGDAAFSGQGVVAETLMMSDIDGYNIGGTIHIIINNQIGFTTNPENGRSGRYPTEFAKIIAAPIFHVNGDDPESVINASILAVEYKRKFKSDVVIDIVCYRLYGHNEGDEPYFTQPIMYKAISDHKTLSESYSRKLISENILSNSELDFIRNNFKNFLDQEWEFAKNYKVTKPDHLESRWKNIKDPRIEKKDFDTNINIDKLKSLAHRIYSPETNININSKIIRQFDQKKKMIESGENIDWSFGEALAFASLLSEGVNIRLSGQDSGRGTFSHRHSVLVDQNNEDKFIPLNNLGITQARYEVIDSNLSEYGVLGFEYGYSIASPNNLVIWEAQFGDFSNGAQIIIDQYISSAENKWLKMSGLVMLLPHSYEGQGPEHSSARIERYLQLCASDNMRIANCTTPASYFHLIRSQIHRSYRKPLIIMSPKSLLRHRLAVSKLTDMSHIKRFLPVITEESNLVSNEKINRIILCSGKIYYDLFEERVKNNINNIAIIRLEQLYPFPKDMIKSELDKYKNAEIYWAQEEPKNMGAWIFVKDNMENILENRNLEYAGRIESASPASGYKKIHDQEQLELIKFALKL